MWQGAPQGRRQRRERFRIPDVLRAYILVDAMNLSDDQFEKVVTGARWEAPRSRERGVWVET